MGHSMRLCSESVAGSSLAHAMGLCRSSRRLVDRFAECMDLSMDRSRLDSYFRGSRPAKPAGALSAPPDLQLTPEDADDAAEGSDDIGDDVGYADDGLQRSVAATSGREEADRPPARDITVHRQQSCCGSMDEDGSDADDEDADLAAGDFDSKPADAAALPTAAVVSAAPRRHVSGSDSPSAGPSSRASDRTAQAAVAVAAAPDTAMAEVKREADASSILADIDLREQAALMALFEDRRRSSQTKRLLAASTNSALSGLTTPAPVKQDTGACGTCQEQSRRLGRSISAPAAAVEVESDSAAKRQRTLRNYFQLPQQR